MSIIRRWIEDVKTGEDSILGMVLCQIMLANAVLGIAVFGVVFVAAKTLWSLSVTSALAKAQVAGGIVVLIITILVIIIALVQVAKILFPGQSDGFDI